MTPPSKLIDAPNISEGWARAILEVSSAPRQELKTLIVSISANGGSFQEDPSIRSIADATLASYSKTPVSSVASTIFPASLWNPAQPAASLFSRFDRVWPRVSRVAANRNGTYFRRFTAFPTTNGSVNQLEHIIRTWTRGNHRRSALQLAVFDPASDHTHSRQRGFPCLHQVAIVPDASAQSVSLTAFYAMQLVLEKGYGNYLGLAHLLEFLGHELGLQPESMTCIASTAKLSQTGSHQLPQRRALCSALGKALRAHQP